MRSITSAHSARRNTRAAARRLRRRPVLAVAGLSLGMIVAAGMTVTTPTSLAEASGSTPTFALASFTAPQPLAAALSPAESEALSAARATVESADASIAAASQVTTDITASKLDIGDAETTVDTAELAAAVERLDGAKALPTLMLPSIIEDVTVLADAVDERVAELRGKLDAAKALKAKQEAEAKAKAAAAAKAAAEAAAARAAEQAQSQPSAPAPVFATGGAVGGTSPADAQATARSMLSRYGWGDDQFGCLVSLWNKESGWNYRAYNASSGAYGIPQALPGSKMGSAGADWQTNPATQIAWGLGYISGRYGTPCGAWGHSQSVGWY
ncbi:lytic transglycosylase domain-containing protein [Microbacterium sp. CFH 31415]|uniref:aggregation-promoting factor C-terminal-like domain-containing protein n=1 Tax=Microbacterium sp. CFH 31415 TaxID=2921732 RepID=UPI001F13CA6D|nr:lytic transglycosylase domain-containing protein [Microbacterium sp. CFH 31415]MCH6229991.1 lytic transglycosylase domain-containing protein [Microbacterium sp. CFH 31415]